MLSKISWSAYWEFLGSITGIYLLVVVVLYYRKDILQLGKRKGMAAPGERKPGSVVPAMPVQHSHSVEAVASPGSGLFSMVHDLMEELKPVFITARESGSDKQELLMGLQGKLCHYLPLKNSEFQEAVLHHIIMGANEQCGIALHGEEIQAVWK